MLDRSSRPGHPRIAVDLLGGDHAPAVVVDGALRASRDDPRLELLLVGPRSVGEEVMAALQPPERARVSVLAVGRAVGMGEPAGRGADRRTSIGAAAAALAAGRADALVSAGATGATVAAAVMAAGRSPGVRRPALAVVLPGPVVLLDAGAGMQVSPAVLVRHAALGAGYAWLAAGVPAPRVGLLSVGSEAGKGDPLRRAADAALRAHPWLRARYVGPVEGDEVVSGRRADVVVTDGFTGNVLLKGVEAAFAATAAIGARAPVPRAAALLGVSATVVVCHGVASAEDLASGVALAARLVRTGVMAQLPACAGLVADPGPDRSGPDGAGAGAAGAGGSAMAAASGAAPRPAGKAALAEAPR